MPLLKLPKIIDPRGNLTFLQHPDMIPFEIKRAFWTYNIPSGTIRGGHAYKTQHELIICLSGSFDLITIDKQNNKEKFSLNRPDMAMHIPPKTWRSIENISTNAVMLHLTDLPYTKEEYIYNIEEFLTNE